MYYTIHVCIPFIVYKNRWGCAHEKDGLSAYTSTAAKDHLSLKVTECGLYVDPEQPYLGASPDGIVTCTCCGKGLVERKCPFFIKEGFPENPSKSFCIHKEKLMENGN